MMPRTVNDMADDTFVLGSTQAAGSTAVGLMAGPPGVVAMLVISYMAIKDDPPLPPPVAGWYITEGAG